MQAVDVRALRLAIQERFPNAQPVIHRTAGAVATGIGPLDGLLPGGGLPRGRVSVWQPGNGVTSLLRASCHAVVAKGERAAWIDARHTLMGADWSEGPLLLRPRSELEALACAEELLRCGGFSLIVLSGTGKQWEREAVRLSRSVHEGGSALSAIATAAPVAHLRMRTRIAPEGYTWKRNPFGEPVQVESVRIEVHAQSMGWQGQTTVVMPVIGYEQRIALDPMLVDRRGAKRVRAQRRNVHVK